jgi:hypothetical protein
MCGFFHIRQSVTFPLIFYEHFGSDGTYQNYNNYKYILRRFVMTKIEKNIAFIYIHHDNARILKQP